MTVPPQSHQILYGPLGLHIGAHTSRESLHAQPEAMVMLDFQCQSHHCHSHYRRCRHFHHHRHHLEQPRESTLTKFRLASTNTTLHSVHHHHCDLRPCVNHHHHCHNHHHHLTLDAIDSTLTWLRLASTNTGAAALLSTLPQNILVEKCQYF